MSGSTMNWIHVHDGEVDTIELSLEGVAMIAECAVKADQEFMDGQYNPYPMLDADYIK